MQHQKDKKSSEKLSKLLSKGDILEILGRDKWKNLFSHVDVSSIVFFRIFFGLIMFVETFRYYDKIERYWILPKHHFYYWPFDFITPLQGNGMYLLFILMGILSIFIVIGFLYRYSITIFFLCFSYTFLLEQARYLNHFYLILLLSFVMIFIPANSSASIDKKIFKTKGSETIPAWSLWLLRFMIALPYFFGGIAKLNSDWLHGEPLRMWLTKNMNVTAFGSLFKYESMILFIVYSGLILDLIIVPLLLFKKTRTWGFILITCFHLVNMDIFNIGIFPWFMIGASTLYFNPDWPRRFINFFSRKKEKWPMSITSKELIGVPSVINRNQKIIIYGILIWGLIHVLIPFRFLFFPGNVNWTEEGQKFAWHMKLRSKSKIASFKVKNNNTGEIFQINVADYLKSWQKKDMEDKPNLIWQFSHMVKDDFNKKGMDVSVYANVRVSLNGREYQQMIDSTVDLASQPIEPFSHSNWIIPLETPLNKRLPGNDNSSLENTTE